MNLDYWLRSTVQYGGDLIRSVLNGVLSASEEIFEEPSSRSAVSRAARSALAPSLIAASLGVAAGYVVTQRKPPAKAMAFGLLGGVLGFVGGLAWGTRSMAGRMARSAMKEVSTTRNAHWLDTHPIDYA